KRLACFLVFISLSNLLVPAQTRLDYPKARKSDQVDIYHGIRVLDPYRWMEDTTSAETREWIAAENKLTDSYLATIPERAKIK
ncbi:hypothetical protein OFN64_38225, partial [Escherichia coli]|nr:hypothetical protein [Escherichia coli]